MAITNNNILKVSPVWLLNGGDEQVNTWHIRVTGIAAQTQTEIRSDLVDYLEYLYADVINEMATAVVHNRVDILNVITGNPELPMGAIAALNGTDAVSPLPAQVAMLVFGRTGISRRIAKKYLPSFSEDSVDGGLVTSAAETRLSDMADKLSEQYTAANGVQFTTGVWNLDAGYAAVIGGAYSIVPATQRRRKVGRGS